MSASAKGCESLGVKKKELVARLAQCADLSPPPHAAHRPSVCATGTDHSCVAHAIAGSTTHDNARPLDEPEKKLPPRRPERGLAQETAATRPAVAMRSGNGWRRSWVGEPLVTATSQPVATQRPHTSDIGAHQQPNHVARRHRSTARCQGRVPGGAKTVPSPLTARRRAASLHATPAHGCCPAARTC